MQVQGSKSEQSKIPKKSIQSEVEKFLDGPIK